MHALTALGVIIGYAGLNAVIGGHARAAILWLVAALVLDGVDGPLARRLDVRSRIPTLDGNSLDLIIDYFTCTIVPVVNACTTAPVVVSISAAASPTATPVMRLISCRSKSAEFLKSCR